MKKLTLLATTLAILLVAHVQICDAAAPAPANPGGGFKNLYHDMKVINFPEEVTKIDTNLQKEALLFSPKEKPEGKIPLIVMLHGAGGTKKKDVRAFEVNRDVRWAMTAANKKYVAKILVPRSTSHWNPAAMNKAVEYILSTNDDIDPSRIYCCGYSLGGLGTWNWARHKPNPLAAVVPVAFIASQENIDNLKDLPVWAMAGTNDRRRAGSVKSLEKVFKDKGFKNNRVTIFEGANHGQTAALAWKEKGLLEWLFSHSKK